MTWMQLIARLLSLGKTRNEIADTIREMVGEGMLSAEEAERHVDDLDRLIDLHKYPVSIVHTESGSIYEIDRKNKRVRRMTGKTNPTPRMGTDGEWRTYSGIQPDPPEAGERLLIVWEITQADRDERNLPTTLTSTIVAINPPLS